MKSIKAFVVAVLAILGLMPASPVKKNVEVSKSVYAGKVNISLSAGNTEDSNVVKLCQDSNGEYKGKFIVKVNPANFKIPGIALKFGFDKTKVNVNSVSFHSQFGGSVWNEDKANNEGILKITGLSLQKQLPSSLFNLAEVQVSALEEGSSEVRLTGDYQIVFEDGNDTNQSDNVLEIEQTDLVKMEIAAEGECI